MPPTGPIALILGATRGIGRALVPRLAADLGPGATVYATARNQDDADRLAGELAGEGCRADVLLFDLADPAAPEQIAAQVRTRHGGVDIVIQNGAAMPRPGVPAAEDARPMIAANCHGTLRVLRAFLPILNPNGRLLIVASGMGRLDRLPEALRARFHAHDGAPERILAVMDAYVAAMEAGVDEGWPEWVNIPAKVGQVAITRAFARAARRDGLLPEGALINAVCPGVTLTDATRGFMGSVFRAEDAQTPEQAAVALAALALLPAGMQAPYGELVQFGRVLPFGD
ncbi:SDR family NAD(P)-dependent oxidoreductase [Sandarakinorhabdus oryzae]|uniref:SDR family NAD(P)-dependent oxidoreductase n=1 Tax=Sandarakinorhabdus oryzae TaxID=2675220 RepID=UPI0012E0CA00|nr:SDR family NAD(P)-dependent oxidoreductase [Sandarakinorhabdus oryzae]